MAEPRGSGAPAGGPLSAVTPGGVAVLNADTPTAHPVLCIKHLLRVFPTIAYTNFVGKTVDEVVEAVVTDGSSETKCILLDTTLIESQQIGEGSIVKIEEAKKKPYIGLHPVPEFVIIERLSVAHEDRAEDPASVGPQTEAAVLARPLLQDREYYLHWKYSDVSNASVEFILSQSDPFGSSLKAPVAAAFQDFNNRNGRIPNEEEMKALYQSVDLNIGKNTLLLEAMCKVGRPSSDKPEETFIGRILSIGRRRHHGRVLQNNRCPYRMSMVIGDCSRRLAVTVWGSMAIRAHAQLQIGDIITIRDTGRLHRFNGELELAVNTTHPKSKIFKEDDVSLAAFSLEERLARWPWHPPAKLAQIHLRPDGDILPALAGLVTYVGPVLDHAAPHPHLDAVTLTGFRWLLLRDESLPGVRKFQHEHGTAVKGCCDVLIGLLRNSQDDPFLDLSPGQIVFFSHLRVETVLEASTGPASCMLMATGETRTVIRSHGAIDYRSSDNDAGKNRALHRLLSTDTGFQRLCSWASSMRQYYTLRSDSDTNGSMLSGRAGKFPPLRSSFFLTGAMEADMRMLLGVGGLSTRQLMISYEAASIDEAAGLAQQQGKFSYAVVQGLWTDTSPGAKSSSSSQAGAEAPTCSFSINGDIRTFVLRSSPTLCPALDAGYRWANDTVRSAVGKLKSHWRAFIDRMGAASLLHLMTLANESTGKRHSKALAAALDRKKGSSKVLEVLRTTPMVIVLKCTGHGSDNVEVVVEGLGFRQ